MSVRAESTNTCEQDWGAQGTPHHNSWLYPPCSFGVFSPGAGVEGALQGFLILEDSLASPEKGRKQGSVWTQLLQKQLRKCEGCAEGPSPGGALPSLTTPAAILFTGGCHGGAGPAAIGPALVTWWALWARELQFPACNARVLQGCGPRDRDTDRDGIGTGTGTGPAASPVFLLSRPPHIYISLA